MLELVGPRYEISIIYLRFEAIDLDGYVGLGTRPAPVTTTSSRSICAHCTRELFKATTISARTAQRITYLVSCCITFLFSLEITLSIFIATKLSHKDLIPVTAPASTSAITSGVSSGDNNAKLLPSLKKKFMECSVDELSIREVGELLSEYRRLVERVRELDRFSAEGD